MRFFSCISEHRTVNNVWKKERETVWWRTNTGERKREGWKRDRNKGKLKHSHIRWGGGLVAAGLFQGWLAFPWRQSEGAMSYALVGTDHPTPPHWKPEPEDAEDRPLEVNASSTVESWWCEVKALLPWWRQSNAVVHSSYRCLAHGYGWVHFVVHEGAD